MATDMPDDLIRLADVMKQYGKSRTWWSQQINTPPDNGGILAYTLPGERGLWLSRAAVEQLLRPRPYERGTREA